MWSTATVEPYLFDRFSTVIMWVPLVGRGVPPTLGTARGRPRRREVATAVRGTDDAGSS
jgi:hypothetical protein